MSRYNLRPRVFDRVLPAVSALVDVVAGDPTGILRQRRVAPTGARDSGDRGANRKDKKQRVDLNSIGGLQGAALNKITVSRYRSAVRQFVEWCIESEVKVDSHDMVDGALSEYFGDYYENSGSFDTAKNTLYGLHFCAPELRGRLLRSMLALKGWKRLEPSQSKAPLTWEVVVVMAVTMARSGYVSYGVASILGFHCLLRISEITSLRVMDVASVGDARLGSACGSMALRLAVTKTGREQFVTITDATVATVLSNYLINKPRPSRVFDFSSSSYRRVFGNTVTALGLDGIPYSPHSLRHGGATSCFLSGMSIGDILFRGRWKATESAKTYVQQGRALLLTADVPQWIHTMGLQLAPCLSNIMLLFTSA